MNKVYLFLIIIFVLGAGGYLLMKSYSPLTEPISEAPQTMLTPTTTSEIVAGSSGTDAGATAQSNKAKEFKVDGNEFAFAPNTLSVAKGDTVNVTFTNTGKYPHNFVINELNVQSKTVQPGQSDTVTFTANKTGSFQYYCSVDSHKDKGMVGTLTVQ
ncbi:hypothetical protein A2Z00_03345 [Candidatus Gottesmanbacteria bacterium RBG_13_45_10]|uniref:EfeO-type cupredoxin-like domain-containing protein n=1 Tax=Candidatus Gottesmanbacteria bacterium RBG_13_45_10 TaxID=1798370 RepID=A0A1F5ZHP4_9BACT|nr:MAG: hypothetical protein A2Z00_03345 [Candidatus Gottesmanbacteria bacterium RBG_13_45_10]